MKLAYCKLVCTLTEMAAQVPLWYNDPSSCLCFNQSQFNLFYVYSLTREEKQYRVIVYASACQGSPAEPILYISPFISTSKHVLWEQMCVRENSFIV